MIYKSNLATLPVIRMFYTVRRNTVWHITDRYNILIIITDGRCKFSAEGKTVEVKKGDTYFIPAGTAYEREPINDEMCTMIYIHFTSSSPFEISGISDFSNNLRKSVELINGSMLEENDIHDDSHLFDIYIGSKTTVDKFDTILEKINQINLFSGKRTLTCSMQSSLALSNILLSLYKALIDSTDIDASIKDYTVVSPRIKKALNYISQNYTSAISLDELSTVCCVSKQQLIRYFKQHLNTTPNNYIMEYKIAKAKEFLFNKDLSIKEISDELGYEDQHYFSRLFRKHTGETPTQYRYRVHHYSDKNE